jgi:hypothetical protein
MIISAELSTKYFPREKQWGIESEIKNVSKNFSRGRGY